VRALPSPSELRASVPQKTLIEALQGFTLLGQIGEQFAGRRDTKSDIKLGIVIFPRGALPLETAPGISAPRHASAYMDAHHSDLQ
jgi:hypothetical protein